eukprot:g567.t1
MIRNETSSCCFDAHALAALPSMRPSPAAGIAGPRFNRRQKNNIARPTHLPSLLSPSNHATSLPSGECAALPSLPGKAAKRCGEAGRSPLASTTFTDGDVQPPQWSQESKAGDKETQHEQAFLDVLAGALQTSGKNTSRKMSNALGIEHEQITKVAGRAALFHALQRNFDCSDDAVNVGSSGPAHQHSGGLGAFHSLSLQCEVRLHRARAFVAARRGENANMKADANDVLTAVACDCFDRLCASGPASHTLQLLRPILFGAIYQRHGHQHTDDDVACEFKDSEISENRDCAEPRAVMGGRLDAAPLTWGDRHFGTQGSGDKPGIMDASALANESQNDALCGVSGYFSRTTYFERVRELETEHRVLSGAVDGGERDEGTELKLDNDGTDDDKTAAAYAVQLQEMGEQLDDDTQQRVDALLRLMSTVDDRALRHVVRKMIAGSQPSPNSRMRQRGQLGRTSRRCIIDTIMKASAPLPRRKAKTSLPVTPAERTDDRPGLVLTALRSLPQDARFEVLLTAVRELPTEPDALQRSVVDTTNDASVKAQLMAAAKAEQLKFEAEQAVRQRSDIAKAAFRGMSSEERLKLLAELLTIKQHTHGRRQSQAEVELTQAKGTDTLLEAVAATAQMEPVHFVRDWIVRRDQDFRSSNFGEGYDCAVLMADVAKALPDPESIVHLVASLVGSLPSGEQQSAVETTLRVAGPWNATTPVCTFMSELEEDTIKKLLGELLWMSSDEHAFKAMRSTVLHSIGAKSGYQCIEGLASLLEDAPSEDTAVRVLDIAAGKFKPQNLIHLMSLLEARLKEAQINTKSLSSRVQIMLGMFGTMTQTQRREVMMKCLDGQKPVDRMRLVGLDVFFQETFSVLLGEAVKKEHRLHCYWDTPERSNVLATVLHEIPLKDATKVLENFFDKLKKKDRVQALVNISGHFHINVGGRTGENSSSEAGGISSASSAASHLKLEKSFHTVMQHYQRLTRMACNMMLHVIENNDFITASTLRAGADALWAFDIEHYSEFTENFNERQNMQNKRAREARKMFKKGMKVASMISGISSVPAKVNGCDTSASEGTSASSESKSSATTDEDTSGVDESAAQMKLSKTGGILATSAPEQLIVLWYNAEIERASKFFGKEVAAQITMPLPCGHPINLGDDGWCRLAVLTAWLLVNKAGRRLNDDSSLDDASAHEVSELMTPKLKCAPKYSAERRGAKELIKEPDPREAVNKMVLHAQTLGVPKNLVDRHKIVAGDRQEILAFLSNLFVYAPAPAKRYPSSAIQINAKRIKAMTEEVSTLRGMASMSFEQAQKKAAKAAKEAQEAHKNELAREKAEKEQVKNDVATKMSFAGLADFAGGRGAGGFGKLKAVSKALSETKKASEQTFESWALGFVEQVNDMFDKSVNDVETVTGIVSDECCRALHAQVEVCNAERAVSSHCLQQVKRVDQPQTSLAKFERKIEEEAVHFARVDATSMEDIFRHQNNSVESMERVTQVLAAQSQVLRNIYRAYSGMGNVSAEVSMDMSEWRLFIADIHIESPTFSKAMIDICFVESCLVNGKSQEKSLDAGQFTEAIVRLAHGKYDGTKSTAGKGDTTKKKKRELHENLERLLTEHLLPYAQKSSIDEFQRRVANVDVQAVFDRHRPRLSAIFKQYAGVGGSMHTIDMNEFVTLLTDSGVIGEGMSRRDLLSIFNNSQTQDTAEDRALSAELNFDEYLEAVAACATYKYPNPYTSFAQHVDRFIQNFFIDRLTLKGETKSKGDAKGATSQGGVSMPKSKSTRRQSVQRMSVVNRQKSKRKTKRKSVCGSVDGTADSLDLADELGL